MKVEYGNVFCFECGKEISDTQTLSEHLRNEHRYFRGGSENYGSFRLFALYNLMFEGVKVKGSHFKLVAERRENTVIYTFQDKKGRIIEVKWENVEKCRTKRDLYRRIYTKLKKGD